MGAARRGFRAAVSARASRQHRRVHWATIHARRARPAPTPRGAAGGSHSMKAAVYDGDQRFIVREIPTPEPGPGQVLVKVKYCAICGTDVHAFLYDIAPPGTVMGHEYAGTVVKLGEGVTIWAGGDRVVGGGGAPPAGAEGLRYRDPRYNYRTAGFVE